MWKSRVLCEISKRLWKSVCDFHNRVISTAASRGDHLLGLRIQGVQTLQAATIVGPEAVGAVDLAADHAQAPVARRFRIR
jgi:hypothetical protein